MYSTITSIFYISSCMKENNTGPNVQIRNTNPRIYRNSAKGQYLFLQGWVGKYFVLSRQHAIILAVIDPQMYLIDICIVMYMVAIYLQDCSDSWYSYCIYNRGLKYTISDLVIIRSYNVLQWTYGIQLLNSWLGVDVKMHISLYTRLILYTS